jgi:hypothetical protein
MQISPISRNVEALYSMDRGFREMGSIPHSSSANMRGQDSTDPVSNGILHILAGIEQTFGSLQ